MRRLTLLFALFALALAACGPSPAPQMIASYPRSGTPVVIATAPRFPPSAVIVYSASVMLDAGDPLAAVEQARRLAGDLGGYTAGAQSWYQDDRLYAAVTIAVPSSEFERARRGVLQLGVPAGESVVGRAIDPGPGNWNPYTTIAVTLRGPAPAPDVFSPPPAWPPAPPGWSPLRTLESAWRVTAAILQFVIDLAIWLIVVGGPFVLVALGVWALVRRRRSPG